MRALLLLLALPAAAQQVQVNLSPGPVTVGDRIEAVINLQVDTGALVGEPRFPTWRETWGEAEILAKSEPEKVSEQNGTAIYQQRLTLAAFRPGNVPLPPVAIALPLRSRTVQASTPEGLSLTVHSVLPKGEKNPQPKPEKPPVRLPIGEAFWWTLAAMSLACLIVGWLLFRQHRARPELDAKRPDLSPFEELADALVRLGRETSAVRLHTALSLAFRHYLSRTLSFRAEQSTTSEIHRHLLAGRLPAPLVRQAVELLRACDLVKFSRQAVGEDRSRERLEAARRIGEEIEERLHPRDAAPLEAAG
ncbi:MAG TPA: hypothetical protein VE078_07115 [Thermoanaerobaculia bacterium]|nr:hypothetical protein [Thermoanaerobaculia bacterium]